MFLLDQFEQHLEPIEVRWVDLLIQRLFSQKAYLKVHRPPKTLKKGNLNDKKAAFLVEVHLDFPGDFQEFLR